MSLIEIRSPQERVRSSCCYIKRTSQYNYTHFFFQYTLLPERRPEQAWDTEGSVDDEDSACPGQALEGAWAEGWGAAEEDDQVVVDVEVVEEGGDHDTAEVAAEGGERAVVGEVVHLPLEHPLGVHELAREVSHHRHEEHWLMEDVGNQDNINDLSFVWRNLKIKHCQSRYSRY